MTANLTLRPACEADIDFLWEMLFYASHSYEETNVAPEDIRSNEDLVGYIYGWLEAGLPGVIGEIGGLAVGAAWLRRHTEDDQSNPVYVDGTTPELAIAVDPTQQNHGIGSALLTDLLSAVGPDIPAIVFSARVGNPAIRLYERHGFETVGTIGNRVGTQSVKMIRTLS